jgi:primosomal protein N' (replication factor Y)
MAGCQTACLFFQMKEIYADIAIPGTVRRLFTYSIKPECRTGLKPGQRVRVPFGKRYKIGYFVKYTRRRPDAALRFIDNIIDHEPLIDEALFSFIEWIAGFYFANIGDVLNAALPPDLRRIKSPFYIPTEKLFDNRASLPDWLIDKIRSKKFLGGREIGHMRKKFPGQLEKLIESGYLYESWINPDDMTGQFLAGYRFNKDMEKDELAETIKSIKNQNGIFQKKDLLNSGISRYRLNKLLETNVISPVYETPQPFDYFKPRPDVMKIKPNGEQDAAIDSIIQNAGHFAPYLLYGITGSGKTLVYCKAAEEIVKSGKSVLVLVPEIALAGTLYSYFRSFFKDRIALQHSALKPKDRLLTWQNIRSGKYDIVIGARSAIFAPLKNLGMIIVDEEHDESYKQDDPAPRFQARDSAVMRARMTGIPIVLGSATPSLESFHNAERNRYKILTLTQRPEKIERPIIRLIDLKKESTSFENMFFTPILVSEIKKALKEGNQVILYHNRRGFSPRVKCHMCGFTPECPNCQISLTYHKSGHKMMCHFCDYVNRTYDKCENCASEKFIYIGTGTQKIEERIAELFENSRVTRLDSDSAGRDKTHRILSDLASGKYNVLLGTQMVTKGIDFPLVSLVGVLMADIGLDMPDFRASEKLFAKLIQVSGRSGRGIIPGEVIIQTFNPNLELIDDAARQDYDTFYQRESKNRKKLLYPPFTHLINFRFAAKKEDDTTRSSLAFKTEFDKRLKKAGLRGHILGPAPCPLYRLRSMYRRHLIIKTRQIIKMIGFLSDWEKSEPNFGLPSRVRLAVDVDPYDMM